MAFNLATLLTNISNLSTSIKSLVSAHTSNKTNPHQVTATQVGAYTTAQSDSNLNSAVSALNQSITNVQNQIPTRQFTISGAAPSGSANEGDVWFQI